FLRRRLRRARWGGGGRWRAGAREVVGSRRRSREQLLARHASTGGARARADTPTAPSAARRAVHRPRRNVGGRVDRAAPRAPGDRRDRHPGHTRSRSGRGFVRRGGLHPGGPHDGHHDAAGNAAGDLQGSDGARPRVNAFVRVVWLVVRKDLTVEVRSREVMYTTLFFAVTVVLVFAFALVKEGR